MELPTLSTPNGFYYSSAPQRSQSWYDLRIGKVTASRLEDWLSVSKAVKTLGKPLKKRLDYERELRYEQHFKVSYMNYISDAMVDGIELEKFAVSQYTKLTQNEVIEVGAWYNEYFVASPDGAVGDDGLVEAKVLRDNSFSDLIVEGLTEDCALAKYWKQVQGQLWASGRKWCDFIAMNTNTKKIVILRITPDTEFHKWLELSVQEELTVPPDVFDNNNVHDFVTALPEVTTSPQDYFN